MFGIIAAFLSGGTIVISRIINAKLSEKIGVFQGTFFNYIVGILVSIICLFAIGDKLTLFQIPLEGNKILIYLGGLVGVIVICVSSVVSLRLSVFNATLFIFIGQLFTGLLLDYILIGKFSIGQFLGGMFVMGGLMFNISVDKKQSQESKI